MTSPKAKMWVALLGAAAIAIAQAFPQYAPYASVIIAVCTTFAVYEVPNTPKAKG